MTEALEFGLCYMIFTHGQLISITSTQNGLFEQILALVLISKKYTSWESKEGIDSN